VSFSPQRPKESAVSEQQRLEPALIKVGVVVVLGTIMSILDTTIVAVALHTLSGDFRVISRRSSG